MEEPDVHEYGLGRESQCFLIDFDRVANSNGKHMHLILFVRNKGLLSGNDAFIEEIYSIEDNQKACFGIHCIKITNGKMYWEIGTPI